MHGCVVVTALASRIIPEFDAPSHKNDHSDW